MKKSILLTLCFTAIISFTANAKIWRVNNNVSIPADFTTAQDAHDGASAGDTIHFESSITSYGNLTMTKKMVLIGMGDFTAATANTQAAVCLPKLTTITINAGSENSLIMVNCDNININSVDYIVAQRCHVVGSVTAYHSNYTTIKNCYFGGSITFSSTLVNNIWLGSLNNIISNNIIGGNIFVSDSYSSATISNNTIVNTSSYGCNIQNSLFQNNIYFAGYPIFYNSTVKNNFFRPSFYYMHYTGDANTYSIASGNNNQFSVIETNFLVNESYWNGTTADSGFQLKAGSPAIGAGVSGEDCGAFGGTSPYKLAVQPAVPAIYKLTVPSSVNNTLNVTLSTKSNN